jgi:hypothetical protein
MSASSIPSINSIHVALAALFAEKAPVLVEVRFPRMGTSSDWFLCDSEDDLEPILERLGPGVEVHCNSVWDVRNPRGAVVWKK